MRRRETWDRFGQPMDGIVFEDDSAKPAKSVLLTIGSRTFVRSGTRAIVAEGMRATKHLPGRHNQQTHGREGDGALQTTISQVESEIAALKHERAVNVDLDGNITLQVDGKERRVSMTPKQAWDAKDKIHIHNHPPPSNNSFSPDDIVFAHKNDPVQIRAVTKDYVYILDRPAKGWSPNGAAIAKYGKAAHERKQKQLLADVRAGKITVEQANATGEDHWHNIWEDLRKQLPAGSDAFNYRRERR